MVVHVNHAIARSACRSCRINFADLLLLCAHFQVDFMGGDFNAFSYRYFRTGSQQTAASLQDSSLAVMLRRFDEAVNAQLKDTYENYPGYQFRSDLYMAYHDKDIEEYRLKRDDILNEVTDAAGESSKIPRLQKALQEYDENFDVIGLVNFNWGHARVKALNIDDRHHRERFIPQSKSTIIKNKYALRYLAGQGENVQDVRHGSEDHSTASESPIKRSGYAPCAQGRLAAVANTCGHEVVDRLHHQVQGWRDLLPSRLVLQVQPWQSAWQEGPQAACSDRAASTNDGPVLPVLECERLCTSATHREPWPRSMQPWSLVHPVHCLHPHSLDCHQQKGELCWGAVFRWQAVRQGTQTRWTVTTLTSARLTVSTEAEQVTERGCWSAHSPHLHKPLKTSFFKVTRQRWAMCTMEPSTHGGLKRMLVWFLSQMCVIARALLHEHDTSLMLWFVP